LLFMVPLCLVPALALLFFYVSTFRSMCAVPNMAVFIIIIIIIIIIICGGGGGGGGFSRSNSDDSGLLSSSVNLD